MWGRSNQVTVATVEAWLGAPLDRTLTPSQLVPRYLAAFGPARPADMATWSRLTGLAAAFQAVRDELVELVDERGRTLFDVPGAPRPDPASPVPVRFLPEYDNVLLSHADRTRIIDDRARSFLSRENGYWPFVLVDGDVRATWSRRDGTITVAPFDELTRAQRDAVVDEGRRLAAALDADDLVVATPEHAR